MIRSVLHDGKSSEKGYSKGADRYMLRVEDLDSGQEGAEINFNTRISGLEKSAAIRPFATKKSRLASERIPFSGQFGD